jgi:DNA-binding NarL/FixJ family response regulator
LPLRTLIVEDHRPFLEYIRSTLREHPELEVVGEAEDGFTGVERAAVLQPDLVFLDIGLPGLNGIEAASRIRAFLPRAKIIFLTQENSPEIVHAALDMGASGYVLKARCHRDLQSAIETVMLGNRFVSEGLDGYGR